MSIGRADDAVVLPAGVNGVRISYTDYLTIDERYDPDGDSEDVATDFDGVALDSSVFPALTLVEQGFMMPAGSASLGDTNVGIEFDIRLLEIVYARGVTDRLSLGIKVPYYWLESNVDASIDSSAGSSATVGLNPFFGMPGPLGMSPLSPFAAGGVPVTTENIQSLLGSGLDVDGNGTTDIPGFGFQRFDSWRAEGIGDMEVQGRYQYHKSETWRHAFTGGIRMPSGQVDDPDNLVDLPFGDGTYAVLLRTNHDYIGLENWTFNFTLKYDWLLPDSERVRVPNDVDQPLTANTERVDRDLGDIFELDLRAAYAFSSSHSAWLRYRYIAQGKDSIDGSMGFNYSALEDETDNTEQQIIVGYAYSTVQTYQETGQGIPFIVNIQYRDRFAGSNNVLNSQYLKTELSLFF